MIWINVVLICSVVFFSDSRLRFEMIRLWCRLIGLIGLLCVKVVIRGRCFCWISVICCVDNFVLLCWFRWLLVRLMLVSVMVCLIWWVGLWGVLCMMMVLIWLWMWVGGVLRLWMVFIG